MGEQTNKPRILVLGGGLAGLSVARAALRTRPCHVTVLEKKEVPGGMARSLSLGGVTTDLGPHRIYSTIPEMRQWFQDFLGDRMYVVRRVSRMYVRGRFLRYPPDPLELMRALGPSTMAMFAGGYLMARMRSALGLLKGDSFAGVMERAFGRPLCDFMVFPFTEKVWKMSPERISPDVARARVTMGGMATIAKRMLTRKEAPGRETTLRTFHYLRGGIGALPQALARDIQSMGGEIVLNSYVQRLIVENGKITKVIYRTGGNAENEEQTLSADFVFSTIPLPDLINSISGEPAPDESVMRAARSLNYLNSILVYVLARRPHLSADHWLYFPEATPRINRAYEPKNFDPSAAPVNRTLLCMEGTAIPGDNDWQRSDEDLARQYVAEIVSTGLLRQEEIVQTFVHRLENAYPVYNLEYRQHLNATLHYMRQIHNLITLGRQGLFLHNNMDHSINMGLNAARCWCEAQDPIIEWYAQAEKLRDLRIVD